MPARNPEAAVRSPFDRPPVQSCKRRRLPSLIRHGTQGPIPVTRRPVTRTKIKSSRRLQETARGRERWKHRHAMSASKDAPIDVALTRGQEQHCEGQEPQERCCGGKPRPGCGSLVKSRRAEHRRRRSNRRCMIRGERLPVELTVPVLSGAKARSGARAENRRDGVRLTTLGLQMADRSRM